MKKVIFDLDGTLADNKHRFHLAEKKDWRAYFAACPHDTPIHPIIELMHTIHICHDAHVEIWSARSDEVRAETELWLRKHISFWAPGSIPLRMRKAGDWSPDVILKESWLVSERLAGNEIIMVFDDRDSVVAMWRKNGIICLQVAEGNF